MSQRGIIMAIIVLGLVAVAYYIGTNRESVASENTPTQSSEHSTQSADPIATETSQLLVGVWKSKDDANFTREFSADGTITDRYAGDESGTSSGTFTVFTSTMAIPDGVTFDLDAGDAYIRAIMDGEGYNFRVAGVTGEELELVYMDRGGMLRFERVQ